MTASNPLSRLGGIEVRISKSLAGRKFAVQIGDSPVLVSPAMWDLLCHAEGKEFDRLLGAIPIKRLPAMPLAPTLELTEKPSLDFASEARMWRAMDLMPALLDPRFLIRPTSMAEELLQEAQELRREAGCHREALDRLADDGCPHSP